MNSTAFVAATPILARATPAMSTSSFTARRQAVVAPVRRPAVIKMINEIDDNNKQIPQGFTAFSEQLNGRAAMIGFALAVATEALTGKGIVGQVSALFDISSVASALGLN